MDHFPWTSPACSLSKISFASAVKCNKNYCKIYLCLAKHSHRHLCRELSSSWPQLNSKENSSDYKTIFFFEILYNTRKSYKWRLQGERFVLRAFPSLSWQEPILVWFLFQWLHWLLWLPIHEQTSWNKSRERQLFRLISMTVAFALPSNKKPQHSVVLVIIIFFNYLRSFGSP